MLDPNSTPAETQAKMSEYISSKCAMFTIIKSKDKTKKNIYLKIVIERGKILKENFKELKK